MDDTRRHRPGPLNTPGVSGAARRLATMATGIAIAVILVAGGNANEGGQGEDRPETVPSARYLAPDDSLSPIVFGDGHVSINDRCIVRGGRLNLRMPPVYVNGHPVGFC